MRRNKNRVNGCPVPLCGTGRYKFNGTVKINSKVKFNGKDKGAQLKLAATESKPKPAPVGPALGATAIVNSRYGLMV
jgi:hypothetical protein